VLPPADPLIATPLQAKKKQMIDLPIPECTEVPDYETFTGRGYVPPPFYVRRRVRDDAAGPGAPAFPAPHLREDEWLEFDVDANDEVRKQRQWRVAGQRVSWQEGGGGRPLAAKQPLQLPRTHRACRPTAHLPISFRL